MEVCTSTLILFFFSSNVRLLVEPQPFTGHLYVFLGLAHVVRVHVCRIPCAAWHIRLCFCGVCSRVPVLVRVCACALVRACVRVCVQVVVAVVEPGPGAPGPSATLPLPVDPADASTPAALHALSKRLQVGGLLSMLLLTMAVGEAVVVVVAVVVVTLLANSPSHLPPTPYPPPHPFLFSQVSKATGPKGALHVTLAPLPGQIRRHWGVLVPGPTPASIKVPVLVRARVQGFVFEDTPRAVKLLLGSADGGSFWEPPFACMPIHHYWEHSVVDVLLTLRCQCFRAEP